MADDVEIKVDDRIAATIASKLREIRGEATAADTAIERLKATLNIGNSAGLLKAAMDAEKFTRAIKAASTTAYSAVGATSSLVERARLLAAEEARAAAAAERLNQTLNRQRTAATGASGSLGQLVGLLASVAGIRTFIDAANDAQTFENKIRAATTSAEQFEQVSTRLYQMAINNRVGVNDLATAYQRFRNAMDGVSDSDVLAFIDTLSKGLVTFGATTGEAASVITQLSQAFNKGKLDGDEFRSVMENFPPMMDALTKSLGVTKAQIYEMSRSGKLSIEVLLEAMKKIAPQIEAQFAKTTPTIAQSIEVLRTKFQQFISENSAASQLLVQAIMLIGDNLNIVVPLVIAFGAAWAVVQIANIIADMYRLIESLTVFISTNALAIIQIGLWVAAIALAIAAVVALARIIAYLTGNGEAFDEWLTSSIAGIGNFAKALMDGFGKTAVDATSQFNAAMDKTKATLNPGVTTAAKDATKSLNDIGVGSKKAADTVVSNMKRIENSIDTLIWKMRDGAAQASKLYQALQAQGGSSGSFQTLSMSNSTNTGSKSSIENITGKGVAGYATGGQFTVGGRGGRDTNPVSFMATKGERVTVETKAQQRANNGQIVKGDTVINFNVYTSDADSFRRSRSQVASDFARIVQ